MSKSLSLEYGLIENKYLLSSAEQKNIKGVIS